jgi:DNA-directed RNA polymerase specialized sigma24 family protein
MYDMRFLKIQPGTGNVPPLWLQPDVQPGRDLDPDVCRELRGIWPWAYRRVEFVLKDAPRAAELLEAVAIDASRRLHAEPEVARNLKGYLIRAFHRRVAREIVKNRHITYEGLVSELEAKRVLVAPDWLIPLEMKICVSQVIALMPAEAQRVVHYRLLDFGWDEIAQAMGIQAVQARNKYYYGIRTAWESLAGNATRAGHWREETDGTSEG